MLLAFSVGRRDWHWGWRRGLWSARFYVISVCSVIAVNAVGHSWALRHAETAWRVGERIGCQHGKWNGQRGLTLAAVCLGGRSVWSLFPRTEFCAGCASRRNQPAPANYSGSSVQHASPEPPGHRAECAVTALLQSTFNS